MRNPAARFERELTPVHLETVRGGVIEIPFDYFEPVWDDEEGAFVYPDPLEVWDSSPDENGVQWGGSGIG